MVGYDPYKKTALKRKTLSVPMRHLHENGLLHGKILDFGCGNGDDVAALNNYGYDIKGYDGFNPMWLDNSLLDERYDVVTCNYVMNVIPSLKEHSEVVDRLKRLGSEVYISVRTDKKAVKPNWKWVDESQGYWTPKDSFQRFYCETMVDIFFGDVEYLINNSSLMLFRMK